jgi:hypothetical protein
MSKLLDIILIIVLAPTAIATVGIITIALLAVISGIAIRLYSAFNRKR